MRKWGMDIKTKKNFFFIDGFSMLFAPISKPSKVQAPETKNHIKSVFAPVIQCVEENDFESENSTIIIEDIDILQSTHALDSTKIQQAILELRKCFSRVIVNVTLGAPLPQQKSLGSSIGHMATRCISCRPLTSGSARRITGFLRLSRMPNHFRSGICETPEDDDKELLYEVTEAGAKVYSKGQVTLQL
ncbi:Elongator complex subunit Elp6 [Schizosaccharomyces pombe]